MTERKTVLSKVTKTLLKNVIRHTDTHNRIVEESEMWKQRGKEYDTKKDDNSFLKDRGLDMNYEFSSSRSKCRAHMDDEPKSSYWMKQLYKAEEEDSNRWGHNGFKQLYPEKFEDSRSSSSEDEYHDRHRKRHKEHRSDREKSKRKKDEKHRKRKHSSSESDSDTISEREQKKSKKKHKHKHKHKKSKKKHKKKEKRKDSESDSR